MEIDKKIIIKLIQVLEDLKKSLKGIEIVNNNDSVEEEIEISGIVIKSPIVGTAYLAPEPGGKKFAEVGKNIKNFQLHVDYGHYLGRWPIWPP